MDLKNYIGLIVGMLMLVSACKKDDNNDVQISRAQLLLGAWSSTSYYSSSIDTSNGDTVSVLKIDGAFVNFEFKSNDQLFTTVVGDSTKLGSYSLNGDSIKLFTSGDALKAYIEQLTLDVLILDAQDVTMDGGRVIADSTHIEFIR